MTYWLSICFTITVIALLVKVYTREFSWREFAVVVVAGSTITGLVIGAGMYRDDRDIQIINGSVVSKKMERVSCSHSYSCHCYTTCSGYGKHRRCSTHCSTCYEHRYDQSWYLYTTVGSVYIDREDRQGLKEPARWTITQPGEPAAATEIYTNYIKAAPDSLFHKIVKHQYKVPKYPTKVYDYYRYNRVVSVNQNVPFSVELNEKLNLALRQLGPYKQVNIIPVFTTYDQNFGEVLQQEWLGGKKNDVVIVVGLYSDLKTIRWVKVFSWSKSSLVNYQIQDELTKQKTINVNNFTVAVVTSIKETFIRRPMSEFKYLEDAIEPPDWAIITACILALIMVGFGCYYMTREGVDL